jgi:hypothetical protein
VTALLVSDREREYTVSLLQGHLVSGRLTIEEFEDRVAEAWSARYSEDLWRALRWLPGDRPPVPARPAGSGTAAGSLLLGLLGLGVFVISLGFLFVISLPLSVSAWGLGREASRSPTRARGAAVVGQVLGIVGTLLALVWMAGCAAIVF